jgi:hypothetical protein
MEKPRNPPPFYKREAVKILDFSIHPSKPRIKSGAGIGVRSVGKAMKMKCIQVLTGRTAKGNRSIFLTPCRDY